eukprot:CAMPEP_0196651614 /NCGR_PEP_ID=MMETSP1086-20130531/656_1 /TAXON_ID=77921 /ORGANISM="Cyanoptyche  gloeocystis , Strain SAG4.97" /LENGTH=34 /DNA_ID= /DNA_START= /DNA_END= /DNA_ORIENTATION=
MLARLVAQMQRAPEAVLILTQPSHGFLRDRAHGF